MKGQVCCWVRQNLQAACPLFYFIFFR